ncbi:nuclear transport factor 2 family protein [Ramlibacter sp. AW1]|uniref:Nuclear transport factor 2 family protein n=1 Tax=Ramlibacter aurantiacus TaxID=2801330 RepID=A0A936ZYU3_9BURK|nr:aromatic-ring-hydroxylating dioxygenase subunit beta [Ramlibacter aurantiacus]MBL0422969.1 nuclear transport factor 2 family protein [Ramlibacter aurantiacus]
MSASSTSADPRLQAAIDLVQREGVALDDRDWDAWLDLYDPRAVFWVPAWLDNGELASDPDTQLSLIYHESRAALEERVRRIRSQKSVVAMPLMRTVHFLSHVTARAQGDDEVQVRANWSVRTLDTRTQAEHTLFGRYQFRIGFAPDDAPRIRCKQVTLVNDRVPTLLDIYCL